MARRQDIDRLLKQWTYQPGEVSARLVRGADGREVLQMRVEMGILQLEVDHRPDGQRPEGADTYFEYLASQALVEDGDFELSSRAMRRGGPRVFAVLPSAHLLAGPAAVSPRGSRRGP